MTISLSFLLWFYGLFLCLWTIFSFIGIYHMTRFGFRNFTTFLATLIYLGISVALLFVSCNYLSTIDWEREVIILAGLF